MVDRLQELEKSIQTFEIFHILSFLVKRNLSQKAKLSIFWSVCVPTLIYDDKFWIVTERMRLWFKYQTGPVWSVSLESPVRSGNSDADQKSKLCSV